MYIIKITLLDCDICKKLNLQEPLGSIVSILNRRGNDRNQSKLFKDKFIRIARLILRALYEDFRYHKRANHK